MVRRERGLFVRRLWTAIAWRELWMGMALAESFGLIALYFWVAYFRG